VADGLRASTRTQAHDYLKAYVADVLICNRSEKPNNPLTMASLVVEEKLLDYCHFSATFSTALLDEDCDVLGPL
jgi:hypothetical protein